MSLVTTIAAILTCVGMAAAIGRRGCSPLVAGTAVASGANMLVVMVLPGYSNVTAAAVAFALLTLVLGGLLLARVRAEGPLAGWRRSVAGLAVVDTAFMSLALLLMPLHGVNHPQASAPPMGGMHGHMPQTAVGGGMINLLVLMAWTACSAVMAVPAMRGRARELFPHAACSGCMVLAMVVMAF